MHVNKNIKPHNFKLNRNPYFNHKEHSYTDYLYQKLSQSESIEKFTQLIGEEIRKHGVFDWTYSLLDLPSRLTALQYIGTVDDEYIKIYVDNSLYEYDFLIQHAKHDTRPIFQSDLIYSINKLPFQFESKKRYEDIIYWNKKFGYDDICIIPTVGTNGDRFLLSLTSKGVRQDKFKKSLLEKMISFKAIAIAISKAGTEIFPNTFVTPQKEFKAVIKSQPLNLLATMGKYDLNVYEAAMKLKISHSTANKHLIKIRNILGANTNHTAYELAKQNGYII